MEAANMNEKSKANNLEESEAKGEEPSENDPIPREMRKKQVTCRLRIGCCGRRTREEHRNVLGN